MNKNKELLYTEDKKIVYYKILCSHLFTKKTLEYCSIMRCVYKEKEIRGSEPIFEILEYYKSINFIKNYKVEDFNIIVEGKYK
jgi:hypothetical protein